MTDAPAAARWRSSVEYEFDKDQAEDIARVVGFRRPDMEECAVWYPPEHHSNIRASISTPFARAAQTGLALLGRLPCELLHEILLELDMPSLLRLRQVNQAARQTVDSLKQYQVMTTHAINFFYFWLRTTCSYDKPSLHACYKVVRTQFCVVCGGFGSFVCLLSLTRCCFRCLNKAHEAQVHSFSSIVKRFNLSRGQSKSMRWLQTLPGTYTWERREYKSCTKVASLLQGSILTGQKDQYLTEPWVHELAKLKYTMMAACAVPSYDTLTGTAEPGLACAGCQLAYEKHLLDTQEEDWNWKFQHKLYAPVDLLTHFRWCDQSQLLWRSSDAGKRQPAELPGMAKLFPMTQVT